MELINTKELRKVTEARKIIDNQQKRIWDLERALDDIARATEIAQYSGQYNVVETYRTEAEELLKDRIVIPEEEQQEMKLRIVTGEVSKDTNDALNNAITEKSKIAAGVK